MRAILFATVALALTASSLQPARAELTFRWLGNSGFTLTDGTTTLLVDPAVTSTSPAKWLLPWQSVQSDEQEWDYWAGRCDIKKLDATFINHTHTDHAIDAPTAVRKHGGILAGSSSARQIGLGHGIPDSRIRVMESGQSVQVGAFGIQAFETPHSPHVAGILFADGDITKPLAPGSSPWDYRVGKTLSYWFTHPEGKILFQAPGRVLTPDVLSDLRPDTLLLTIANRPSSEMLIQNRILPSGARRVIPLHWDNFFFPLERSGPPRELWLQKTGEFTEKVRTLAPAVPLLWPEYCKPIRVDGGGS